MASPRGYFQAKDVVLYYAARLPNGAALNQPHARWDMLATVVHGGGIRSYQFNGWWRLHGHGPLISDAGNPRELHHSSLKRVRGVQSFSPFKKELNTVSFGEWGNQNRVQFVGVRQGSTVEFNFNLNFSDPTHRALRALPLGHTLSKQTTLGGSDSDLLMMYFNKRPDLQPRGQIVQITSGGRRPIRNTFTVRGLASEEAFMIIEGEVIKNELTPPDSVEGSWFNVTIGVELSEDLVLRINPFQEVK